MTPKYEGPEGSGVGEDEGAGGAGQEPARAVVKRAVIARVDFMVTKY